MRFYISTPLLLLQQIRLLHALSESSYEIILPVGEGEKIRRLKDYFNARFSEGTDGDMVLDAHITIEHSKPQTGIGNLSRPLIFPHIIPNYCRSLWGERTQRFSFIGLITDKRQTLLDAWAKHNIESSRVKRFLRRARNKITRLTRLGRPINPVLPKEFLIWSSTNGRVFPGKSWDDDYFRVLARSQFVLCPNGDYVWSYRFFEAALCGAIPVVEETCEAYQGFHYYMMEDRADTLVWSEADAIHNFALCVDRITLPLDLLEAELTRLAHSQMPN